MKNYSTLIKGFIVPVTFFVFWFAGSFFSYWNSYLLPSPADVAGAFRQVVTDGLLFKHLAASFVRVFSGFSIAALFALPLGFLLGMFRQFSPYLDISLEALRHIPPLATVPILILWFGIGELPKLMIVVMATFFPIFFNTLHGVTRCDVKWIEVAHSFDMKPGEIFRFIVLPASLPAILVGMRLGLGYSWRALIGAELIAASSGIGYMILDAEHLSRPDIVIVGILTIGIMGTLIDWIFFGLTKKLIPWKVDEETDYGRG